MPFISIQKAVDFAVEGSQYNITVNKSGTGKVVARLTASGSSNRTAAKYPGRSIKDAYSGDFYIGSHTIIWDEDDESSRIIPVSILRDTRENEQPKYFKVSLKVDKKSDNYTDVKVKNDSCMVYILEENNVKDFFSQYVTGDFQVSIGEHVTNYNIPETVNQSINVRFVDPMGEVFPANFVQVNYKENQLDYVLIDRLVSFWIKLNFRITGTSGRNELSQYMILSVELPFENLSKYPIPVTISSHFAQNFRGQTEENYGLNNSSMTGYIAPNSNLIFFEFIPQPDSEFTANLVSPVSFDLEPTFWCAIQGTALVEPNATTKTPQWTGEGHDWT